MSFQKPFVIFYPNHFCVVTPLFNIQLCIYHLFPQNIRINIPLILYFLLLKGELLASKCICIRLYLVDGLPTHSGFSFQICGSPIFFYPKSYIFCDLKLRAKFQNPRTIPSGRKVKIIVDTSFCCNAYG